jgi:hypothetical protein
VTNEEEATGREELDFCSGVAARDVVEKLVVCGKVSDRVSVEVSVEVD